MSLVVTFITYAPTALAMTPTKVSEVTGTMYLTPQVVEKRVREYFSDAPTMIEIARCESKFRQFTDAGTVLRGGSSGGMVGVFQFFESIHAGAAKTLGHDLATLEGNLAYARHVYESEGTAPWNSAKACWNTKSSGSQTLSTPKTNADLQARIDLRLKLISLLQLQLKQQHALR